MLGSLGEAAVRTLLLAAMVQLGIWVLRIRRAQLLLVTWTVVLAASLAMPALQWATPLRLPISPGQSATWLIGAADLQQQTVRAVSSEPVSTADVQGLPGLEFWLGAAYLLVSSIMVLRLIVGVALSLRLLGRAVPMCLPSAPNVQVRISRAVAAPVTVGNVILLPPDVVEWPPAMRQAAIAHECAHVARGDFALLVLSQFNRALFWFNPVSWLLHRRLAALAELASDDHAMTVTGDRTGYAEVLLEMGRRSGPLLRGLAMARASTLRYRIERVLSDRAELSPVSGLQRSMIVVGAAIVSIAAASPSLTPGAQPSPIARGRLRPALASSDGFASLPMRSLNTLPQPSPVPSLTGDASRPSLQATAPASHAIRLAPQQPLGMQVAARPAARPMIGSTYAAPARARQVRYRATDTQGDTVARTGGEAVIPPGTSPGILDAVERAKPIGGAGEAGHARASPREGHPPLDEPSLMKAIDQQTCYGAYLPGPVGGPPFAGGWGSLNIVRAKFFREADGMSWLQFFLGVREPVNLPITVAGRELEFTAANNTSFKILPQGANHLTGTTQRPYGTIDLACGKDGTHLFDRKG